jgi:hypothetical protein
VVFQRQRRIKKRHDAITGELIDRIRILMDLVF